MKTVPRLDQTYAIVKPENQYLASYTCIRFRFAQIPMVKTDQSQPPKNRFPGKFIF